jgi:CheY-like chemotaxis protein
MPPTILPFGMPAWPDSIGIFFWQLQRFRVGTRAAFADGMRPAAQPTTPFPAPPARVLFIDDHPDGKGLYIEYLEFCGFRVTIASGLDLSGDTDVNLPDVIVIDLALLRVDGFETIRQLKAHPTTSRIPMVALSGLSSDDIPLARAAGADVCLAKPCVPSQVARAIQTLLVWQRSRQFAIDGSR